MTRTAFLGARIFDGEEWIEGGALLINDGVVEGVVAATDVPFGVGRHELDGGMLVPGFIDLQVNGGGGVLLNDDRSLSGLRTICGAHYQFGTTALLPTLITDTPEITAETIEAGKAALAEQVPGFIGLHLEGPHLSIARKGAHDPALIRAMNEKDLANLVAARQALPHLLSTVAAETVTPEQIARLAEAGVVVSIGHSDASMAQVAAAAEAGASMATHLFNAMSQIGNREPGVAGAVLALGKLSAGLIADGIHVHPETIGIALRAKTGPANIFLVTDAMALTGSELQSFTLNGRVIHRADGALRLEDGTLAGADLTMIDAIKYMRDVVGISLEEALRMATLYPARAIGAGHRHGFLGQGAVASFVHLSDELGVRATWIDGASVFVA